MELLQFTPDPSYEQMKHIANYVGCCVRQVYRAKERLKELDYEISSIDEQVAKLTSLLEALYTIMSEKTEPVKKMSKREILIIEEVKAIIG